MCQTILTIKKERFVEIEDHDEFGINQERAPCPCCGFLTMFGPTRDTYDICPVCRWEDDEVQYDNPDYAGGANHESLNQARANYVKFGAKNKEYLSRVRPPHLDEIPQKKE